MTQRVWVRTPRWTGTGGVYRGEDSVSELVDTHAKRNKTVFPFYPATVGTLFPSTGPSNPLEPGTPHLFYRFKMSVSSLVS